MATTINQYSVGLTLDAKDYIDASKLSATETRKLTADINAARSPAETYSREHDRLTAALNKGAISEQTYNRLLEAKQQKLQKATGAVEKQADAMERLSQVGNIVTGAYHAVRSVIEVAMGPIRLVQDMWQEMDRLAAKIDEVDDASQKLGVSFTDLIGLRAAAKEMSGSDTGLDAAFLQMMKRGFGGDNPVESFLQIADEIAGMATQSERVQRAFEVFGRQGSQLLPMLQGGTDAIRESAEFAQRWVGLTDAQAMGVAAYGDSWGRVQIIVEGVSNTMAAEMAPMLTLISEDIIAFAEAATRSDSVMRSIADHLAIQYGFWKEIAKAAMAANLAIQLQFAEAGKMFASLQNPGDAAIAELLRLHAKRKQLEEDAAEAADNRNQKQLDAIGQQHDAHIRLKEEYDREMEGIFAGLADKAIAEARAFFENERNRDMKNRQDMVSLMGGSSMEVGSSQAFKFLADQRNQAMGVAAIPERPTPGEDEIIRKANEQLQVMIEQRKQQEESVNQLRELVDISKLNGFRRLR